MFQPKYGTDVYYYVDSAEKSGDDGSFVIRTTFYKDADRTEVLGRTALTLAFSDGKVTIASLESELG